MWQVEVVLEVFWGGRVIDWMTNVVPASTSANERRSHTGMRHIHSTSTVAVVWALDIVTAHALGFRAYGSDRRISGCSVRNLSVVGQASVERRCGVDALLDLIETSADHEVGESGVRVHRVVDGLDAIGVVHSELGIVPYTISSCCLPDDCQSTHSACVASSIIPLPIPRVLKLRA